MTASVMANYVCYYRSYQEEFQVYKRSTSRKEIDKEKDKCWSKWDQKKCDCATFVKEIERERAKDFQMSSLDEIDWTMSQEDKTNRII